MHTVSNTDTSSELYIHEQSRRIRCLANMHAKESPRASTMHAAAGGGIFVFQTIFSKHFLDDFSRSFDPTLVFLEAAKPAGRPPEYSISWQPGRLDAFRSVPPCARHDQRLRAGADKQNRETVRGKTKNECSARPHLPLSCLFVVPGPVACTCSHVLTCKAEM
jgi:hypothetical protein